MSAKASKASRVTSSGYARWVADAQPSSIGISMECGFSNLCGPSTILMVGSCVLVDPNALLLNPLQVLFSDVGNLAVNPAIPLICEWTPDGKGYDSLVWL